jgi:hypothetical protein
MSLRSRLFGGREGVTIQTPIKNEQGEVIGTLRIHEDGTFTGHLHSGAMFQDAAGMIAKLGYTDGVLMKPIPIDR